MKKLLKFTGIILSVLILLAILASVLLATFVNPNRFKPLIAEEVKKHTGRDLIIDGNLSWSVFPYLGVKIGHLELKNPPEFKQKTFAEIESATLGVSILPLLHSKIESSGITLKGLKLFLIKNAHGKTNWEDFGKHTASASTSTNDSDTSLSPAVKKAPLGIAVAGVTISNANINWVNEQTKQYFDIENFDLRAKNIRLTQPFPLEVVFHFSGKNPELSGKISLSSQIALNLEKNHYSLHNLNLTVKLNEGAKNYNVNLKGDIAADLAREKLIFDNLKAQMANVDLVGKMTVSDLSSKPQIEGHFQLQPLDVKKWLQLTGQDVASIQTLKNLQGEFDFSGGTSVKSMHLQGKLKIDELKASKVRIDNINAIAKLQNGILNITSVTAPFYQGNLEGQAKVDLNASTPKMHIQAKIANVQAEPLLADLAPSDKLKLTGTGNVELQVTTAGLTGDAIVKNLNGTSKIIFKDGVIKGIDIGYLVDSAYAFATRKSMPTDKTDETKFGSLTANAVIRDGVIHNNDLYLNSSRFETRGNGSIDLVNKKINYLLKTTKPVTPDQKNNLENMYGIPIPILLSGSLNKPSISLDMNELMKAIAQQDIQKIKEDAKEKIQGKLKDKFPGKAGDFINGLLGN